MSTANFKGGLSVRDGKMTISGYLMIICLTVLVVYTIGFWIGIF